MGQKRENNDIGIDDRSCEVVRTTSSSGNVPNLPDDCLNIIFSRIFAREDKNSFGLTCHQWLNIQNNNRESLWYSGVNKGCHPECFTTALSKLLIRFQHLKSLGLICRPRINDSIRSKSQLFGSEVEYLCIHCCFGYTDIEFSLIFSWFPRLTHVCLETSRITDKGLEALAKLCPSLEKVNLSGCNFITDSGIEFLTQNCRLHSLLIEKCPQITRNKVSLLLKQ